MSTASDRPPMLRVIHGGEPTSEEIAALTAGLALIAARAREAEREAPRSEWSSRAHSLRRPLRHGPGAWRASALPVH